MLSEGCHGVVNLLPLLLEVLIDGPAQLGVRDVMGAVRQAGQVAPLQLVLPLRASLHSRQPALNGRLQSLRRSNISPRS